MIATVTINSINVKPAFDDGVANCVLDMEIPFAMPVS